MAAPCLVLGSEEVVAAAPDLWLQSRIFNLFRSGAYESPRIIFSCIGITSSFCRQRAVGMECKSRHEKRALLNVA